MTTSIVVSASPVNPSLWSNFIALFGTVNVALGTVTTIVSSVDDLALAGKAQTSLIKDTSINDADLKRIDLADRIAARQALRLTTSTPDAKS